MPALELSDVAVKVLGAELVIDALVAPLQHRPERLHAVRVGHAVNVFLRTVLDRRMGPPQPRVGQRVVRVDHRIRRRVPMHEALKRRLVRKGYRHGGYLIRLPVFGPDDGGLANRSAPLALLLVLVLVGLFPADVGLVHLDRAACDIAGMLSRAEGY